MRLPKRIEAFSSLLVTCLLCILWDITEGAVPRRSLYRASMLRQKSRHQSPAPRPQLPNMKFSPSITKCCKVGELTAKKRMSCNLDHHIVTRNRNMVHKAKLKVHGPVTVAPTFSKMLTYRIERCISSKYSPNFEKCCLYREDLYRQLDDCRQLRSGAERKRCRKEARMRYSV